MPMELSYVDGTWYNYGVEVSEEDLDDLEEIEDEERFDKMTDILINPKGRQGDLVLIIEGEDYYFES